VRFKEYDSQEVSNMLQQAGEDYAKFELAEKCWHAALRLHHYLADHQWNGTALIGPDSGIRINYRLGRFVKSYLNRVPWNDDYYYLQAQGYWILSNWRLFQRSGETRYRDMAIACSRFMLSQQRDDGAWLYPNREWKGRIATAEGTWGSLGLIESFRQTGAGEFLDGALRWHRFLHDTIGFQQIGDQLAVNYFASQGSARVPNNSAFVLRFLAALTDATGESSYLNPCAGLITFMQRAQKRSGEFPYSLGAATADDRPHFQCYQYNAFQCLDLMAYYEMTADPGAASLFLRTLKFLAAGLAVDGHAPYDCSGRYRQVTYHTAVLAASFEQACRLGIGGYASLSARSFNHLLQLQRPDGGFFYSRRDYRIFEDRRSYPRYLAMILFHLLGAAGGHSARRQADD
jgi:hypothetical protein